MGRNRSAKTETPPLRFDQKLVLNQWMLSLLEVNDFDKLAEHLKSLELEGLDENNVHKFLHQMKLLWEYEEFPGDTLLGYDQNIVKHTLTLSEKRAEPLRWKYFQYLCRLESACRRTAGLLALPERAKHKSIHRRVDHAQSKGGARAAQGGS